jgi:hypothetical protein
MITLDVTETPFIVDLDTEDANQWMNDNVGKLLHDETYLTYGVGWHLEYDSNSTSWVMLFENDKHSTLFLLRWS